MNNSKKVNGKSSRRVYSRSDRAVTLIALVITIIVLIILAGVTLNMLLGENGIVNRTKTARDENEKATATETMNLKITNVQISKYAEEQRMPTLKELADNFCEDDDFQYVQETSEVASLTKITSNNPTSIYTKLKAYPYEFEINSSLQLASIDGVKVASNETTEYVSKAQYDSLLARVVALENNSNSQSSSLAESNNYSTEEKVIGTWTDGKPLYKKVVHFSLSGDFSRGWNNNYAFLGSDIDTIVNLELRGKRANYSMLYSIVSDAGYLSTYQETGDKYRKPSFAIIEYTKTTDKAK